MDLPYLFNGITWLGYSNCVPIESWWSYVNVVMVNRKEKIANFLLLRPDSQCEFHISQTEIVPEGTLKDYFFKSECFCCNVLNWETDAILIS